MDSTEFPLVIILVLFEIRIQVHVLADMILYIIDNSVVYIVCCFMLFLGIGCTLTVDTVQFQR